MPGQVLRYREKGPPPDGPEGLDVSEGEDALVALSGEGGDEKEPPRS